MTRARKLRAEDGYEYVDPREAIEIIREQIKNIRSTVEKEHILIGEVTSDSYWFKMKLLRKLLDVGDLLHVRYWSDEDEDEEE